MSSMMSWLWGSSKAPPKPTPAIADPKTPQVSSGMQSILDAEDVQLKREALLQKKIAKELLLARDANQKGNRAVAMRHLQKKKQMAEELTRVEAHLANLSTMRMKLEEQQMTLLVFQANQDAAEAFKKMEVNPDDVEAQMDKVRTAMENATEFANRLAEPLDCLYDEDDLLSELMDFELTEQQQEAHGQVPIPHPQTTRVSGGEQEDDLLLEHQTRMLQAE